MNNLGLFVDNFLAYLFVLIIIVLLVILACFIGTKLWKQKGPEVTEDHTENNEGAE